MARTNFQYEKRQRELEKKRKAEEKARRKQDAKRDETEGPAADADTAGQAGDGASDGPEQSASQHAA